jgi:hypothetical protein
MADLLKVNQILKALLALEGLQVARYVYSAIAVF